MVKRVKTPNLQSEELGAELCEKLGINVDDVLSMTVNMIPNKVATLTVEFQVDRKWFQNLLEGDDDIPTEG